MLDQMQMRTIRIQDFSRIRAKANANDSH